MRSKSVSFKETCPTIDFSFELVKEEENFLPQTLVIKVDGTYRAGSAGDDDARLIKGIMNTATDLWNPETVLLDLREFQYEWGDYIDYIFDGPEDDKPFAIVVGPDCRFAISSLLYGLGTDRDVVDNLHFFEDINTALDMLKMHKQTN